MSIQPLSRLAVRGLSQVNVVRTHAIVLNSRAPTTAPLGCGLLASRELQGLQSLVTCLSGQYSRSGPFAQIGVNLSRRPRELISCRSIRAWVPSLGYGLGTLLVHSLKSS